MKQLTNSAKETEKVGENIATTLQGGDILLLYGDLGAGKTTLTKGIVKELGIEKSASSPTFTLMNVYEIKTTGHKKIKTLVHIDTYRLENEQELLDIGVEDYLGQEDTVCIFEWPEKITSLLAGKKCIEITLSHMPSGREIIMEPRRQM